MASVKRKLSFGRKSGSAASDVSVAEKAAREELKKIFGNQTYEPPQKKIKVEPFLDRLFEPIRIRDSSPFKPIQGSLLKFGGRRKIKTRKKRGGGLSWEDAKNLDKQHVTVQFSKDFANENEISEIIGDVKLIVETHGYGEDAEDVIKIIFKHNDGEDETYIFVEKEYGNLDGDGDVDGDVDGDDKKIVVLNKSTGNSLKSAEAGGARIKRGRRKKKTHKKRKKKSRKKRKFRKRKKTKKRRKRRK